MKGELVLDIKKAQNESVKDYKIRLGANKDLLGLTWQDVAELINRESGESWSERHYRTWYPAYTEGYEDGISTNVSDDGIIEEYDAKRILFEQERMKLSDARSAYNKVLREQARDEVLAEIIQNGISKMEPYTHTPVYIEDIGNDLFIPLDDIHYGVSIENHWNVYNPEVAKQRFDIYLSNIRQIQRTHNAKNCYVCSNGDLISGNIHKTIQLSNRENVVKQIMGVSELISWFLAELSNLFDTVTFSCVPGNHSRIAKKKDAPKDERMDDLIPFYVKARLQNISNIVFVDNTIDSTFNIVNVRGLNYLNVHGDYDSYNNVSKLLDMIDDKIYCIHFGHLHHNSFDCYQKYKLIMSGSFQGVDDYCIEHRIYGQAEQMVCVCNKTGILCQYPVGLQ